MYITSMNEREERGRVRKRERESHRGDGDRHGDDNDGLITRPRYLLWLEVRIYMEAPFK